MIAIAAILFLPRNETLFGGMLVISPLTSLFKIICLALAFFTILLTQAEKAPRHPGEYLALVLLATVGLMLLVGSEELLMIFIGLELLGLSLYVLAAFDKQRRALSRSWSEIFSCSAARRARSRSSGSAWFTECREQPVSPQFGTKLAEHISAAAACGRNRHDARRVRIQNRCRAVPSLGA